jgi:precorrin-6B C5,15-methyltransferase / cobalt-precorrin-6B C5,C15-methyltransferase
MSALATPRVTVVGIGADGFDGLSATSRDLVLRADVLLGGRRHLAFIPVTGAVHEPWPSPLLSSLPELIAKHDGKRVVVLASGDPLVSGIATNLVALLGPEHVDIHPALSSVALARARMSWSAETTDVVTLVGRDHDTVRRFFGPGRRLVVLSSDGRTPYVVAAMLVRDGYGDSAVTVLADLGSPDESRVDATAATWRTVDSPALNVLCIDVVADPETRALSLVPGLPDEAFEHDGQLTKRDLRASALSRLAPLPGELLWDVGAGAGSVGIEWLRTDTRCRAVAVERSAERAERIVRNAARLGVPGLDVRTGDAPGTLTGLPDPDAVFVGGGATAPGVLDTCWDRLRPGGRLVAHAVTLESEQVLVSWHRQVGGELTRVAVEQAGPLGSFTGWQPARPVVQWSVTR